MKPCQLCGAKSWGEINLSIFPTGDIEACTDSVRFLLDKDLSQYRRCDGCGAFASLVQMALEDPPRRDPVESSLGILTPGPANPITMARDMLQGMMPRPETRLERLVRAMLQSPQRNEFAHQNAPGMVAFARQLEIELENASDIPAACQGAGGLHNPLGVGGGPWLVLSWKAQTDYESWIIDLLRLLRKEPQWRMPQSQLDIAVEYATRTRAHE